MDRETEKELIRRSPTRDEDMANDKAAHDEDKANPPHTTTGKMTSPKFGSAGSGGLEYEPGLDKD